LQATPAGVLQRDLPSLIRSGDRRWALPTREAIAASRAESLRGLLEGPLANEPVEVVIVGDITVDEAIARTAATFGALPARRDDAVPAPARAVKFPAATATPVRLSHKGRPDQAVGYVAWPVPDFTSDPDRARVFSVLSDVLRLRLEQELREGQAVTYSPQTTSETSWTFPGYGYVAALIEAPPEKLDGFFADVAKIARDLRDNPVSADELERARKPRVENVQRQRNSNEYWAPRLAAVQTDRTREAALRDILPSLGKVTPAQIQQAARQYLRDDRAWKLAVTPEAKASGGGS
jgi:zinc protease